MKAFMFPGFDSLDAKDQRLNCLKLDQVKVRLNEASRQLNETSRNKSNLIDFVRSEDSKFNSDYSLKIVCSLSVQVGIFNELILRGHKPDILVGCSLGDLARTVCAGVASFSDVVNGGYDFGHLLMSKKDGAILRCTSKTMLSKEDVLRDLPSDVFLSVFQTPQHFLVAGTKSALEKWSNFGSGQAFRSSFLFDVPLHSPLMQPAADKMSAPIDRAPLSIPLFRTFSAVWKKEIREVNSFRSELQENICKSIDWVGTMKNLIINESIRELVNIGPAMTLIQFCGRIPLSESFMVDDGLGILLKPV